MSDTGFFDNYRHRDGREVHEHSCMGRVFPFRSNL